MARFIVRRLLGTIPVLFGLSIILFAFIHLLPGDPASAILGQHSTPERVAALRAYMGLDDPLWQQYLRYLNNLLHGDLGLERRQPAARAQGTPHPVPGDHRADRRGDDLRGRASASRSGATPHGTRRAGPTAR